jgi:sugar transferase (PEP-CTERM system associated)
VGLLDDDPAKQGQVMGSPAVLGTIDQLMEVATKKNVNTAVLAITQERSHDLINRLLKFRLRGLNILDMPEVYERLTRRVPVGHIRDGWLTFASGFDLLSKDYIQKIKRLIDFGVSGLLILITFPVTVLTALAIWLDSPGPVFFRQERVGKGENPFTLWKFRSMNDNAEANGAVWADQEDSRITRVGKWIRLLRIDEIPQLYNVFRGEMSLIGPRPERPEFVQELKSKIPHYGIRHSVRPGITGWAQVNYQYGSSIEDALIKLEYEIYYIKNMSLILDIKILLKTIGVVILGQGAR